MLPLVSPRAAMELDFAALGDLYAADYGAPSSAPALAPSSTMLSTSSPSPPVAPLGQRGAGPGVAQPPRLLGERRDAPLTEITARAKRDRSTSLLSETQRQRLLKTLKARKSARPSSSTHRPQLRTWLRMHRRWLGDEEPMLPLTPS